VSERRTAMITGASGGIGAEFARLLAGQGYDVVLTARSGEPMAELARYVEERFGVEAIVLPKDLGVPGAAPELLENLAQRHHGRIDVLVNSAGFTQLGPFSQTDEAEMLEQVRVNMETLTHLTRLILPGMIERGRGIVVNLSSNAAFLPGPGMAVYYATKAYVLSLSLALAEELRGSGVTVTALCPGPTASGFQSRGRMQDVRLVKGRRLPSATDVAVWGWEQAQRGRPYAVHRPQWRAGAFATRFLPRSTAARFAASAHERVR
jgi:short-subunit dehydrogenase